MAGLFAPEINTVGASALSGGMRAPDNIDYSNLFQSIVDITEPKKVSEADKKSEERRRLNYDLNKINAIENPTERETQMRFLRRTAEGNYSLTSDEINKQFENFTGLTPFDEKSAQQIMNETVVKFAKEDPDGSLYLPVALAEAKGDTEEFMRLMTTKYYEVNTEKQKNLRIQEAYNNNKISRELGKEQYLSNVIVENEKLLADYTKNFLSILDTSGDSSLTGDALYQSIVPKIEKLEQDVRNKVRVGAAQTGVVLSKEEEDRAVAGITEKLTFIKNMSENNKKILTAKQAEETLRMFDMFPPSMRPALNSPEGSIILFDLSGGRPAAAEIIKRQMEGGYGMFGPSVKADPNATYNPGVEGPDDSPTTVQKRLPFYSVESVQSAMRLGDQEKINVLALISEDMKNPARVSNYNPESVNTTLKGFAYGYSFFDNALDPQGNTLTKKVIDNMFGGQALVFAEALAKKSPENAPDMYNKMVNMSAITADRMIAKVKANLDIINRTAMGNDLPNPFVFKADPNGNITGSFNPQTVSKNPYIQKSLTKYGVFGDKPYTQETFWAVMEDYTSVFDKSAIISGNEYSNVKDGIDSLQTLAKFSLKIPGASEKPNAHSTILARIPSLFSGTEQSLEEMAPAEIRRRAEELQVPPRARIVQGNRP